MDKPQLDLRDAHIAQLTDALAGMVESFDILMKETPVGSNPIAAGVVRGAFIGAVDQARSLLPNRKTS